MAVKLISYDLVAPGRNYDKLYEQIKKLGSWWHCLESVWLVVTDLTCGQIRDHLASQLDQNDRLVILVMSSDDWATWNLSKDCSDWLRENI